MLNEAKNLMDWTFFKELLSIDSTTGREREVAEWLLKVLEAPSKQAFEVGDGTLNLLLSWGTPQVVFCTHMDTVPPYLPPVFEGGTVKGRGANDAKGQLFALYTACKELEAEGCSDFGLLLLSGEETGSWGAKAFAKTDFRAPFLIVGEPTENKMVSASKGTLSYNLTFTGEAFHSGYPQYGVSAVDLFNQFYNALKTKDFGLDPELGETTWNVGLLHSDNPQNILSPELTCRLYFRTTFRSHQAVQDWMQQMAGQAGHDACGPAVAGHDACGPVVAGHDACGPAVAGHDACGPVVAGHDALGPAPVTPGLTGRLSVTRNGSGDAPAHYVTLPGLPSAPVSFGSDAPHLSNFGHKIICGPGSIRTAHRSDEHILVSDLETAVRQYKQMYHALLPGAQPIEP